MKRGQRVVHGDKELSEKLGRKDPCPCGSGLKFKTCCLTSNRFYRTGPLRTLIMMTTINDKVTSCRPLGPAGSDRASVRVEALG